MDGSSPHRPEGEGNLAGGNAPGLGFAKRVIAPKGRGKVVGHPSGTPAGVRLV
jgi:hypothetical protein